MSLSWRSDSVPLGEPIVTRFQITDEDGTLFVRADFESWIARAYQGSDPDPIWQEDEPQAVADLILDTPGAWDEDDEGYNGEHRLVYSAAFQPAYGADVRLVIWLKRVDDLGLLRIEHTVPIGFSEAIDEIASLLA